MSVATVLLPILLLFATTELALRLVEHLRRGRAAAAPAAAAPAAAAIEGRPTLLCVGDSNTYGLNLPRGESYPCHLQALVGERARVVNRGWPGASSSLMAAYLPGWLAADHPAVVYVMAGINNRHNPLGGTYEAIIERGLYRPSRCERLRRVVHRELWYLRVYRALFWTFGASEGGWSEAVAPSDDTYAYFRSKPYDSYEGAQHHSMKRQVPDPWTTLEREELAPASAAVAICGYFDAIGPGAELSEYDINLVRHARQRYGREVEQVALASARQALSERGYRLLTEAVERVASDTYLIEQMLWFDLLQMRDACAAAGAQMVLLTYPSHVFAALIDSFSHQHGVPWIDSHAAFGVRGIRKLDKTPDGKRLNSTGNLRLAQHVLGESLRRGHLSLDADAAAPRAGAD